MVLWHPRLRVHIAAQMAALAISPTHRSFLPLWTQEILSKAGQQGLFPQPVIAGRSLVGRLLKDELTFNLQANAKVLEGSHHPDRNAQFEHIADRIKAFRADNQPVISVDAKKKELIGDYKNNGREWRPQGEPERVNVHDFAGQLGKANPYGVYDSVANAGLVGVGLSADTAEFAVETIRRWYHTV